ncbi:hypothetical protein AB4Z40_19775 [Bosea sp. 2YAB26]|uniref:hypothetical protein n=1 Tax=Bosea sp. 2YAB26 TaxID=3237478 RepID=UPI003F92DEB6
MDKKLTPPSLKEIVSQLRYDWFGKDVQQTPTVSYVWTADQFGHFGLGFQITFLFSWILAALFTDLPAWKTAIIAALLNMLLWIVKEVLDIVRERRRQGPLFPFNRRELWWNVATALFFIGAGAIVAGASGLGGVQAIVALLVMLVPATLLVLWWVKRKMTFQQVGLPFLFRLTNLCSTIERPDPGYRDALIALSEPPTKGANAPRFPHVLLTGTVGSGKTCLACGIGTEYAFRLGIARYTTLVKLFEAAVERKEDADSGHPPLEEQDGRILWPWRNVDLLIVDDVDALLVEPPLPKPTTATAAEATAKRPVDQSALRRIVFNQLAIVGIQRFRTRRTVWVVSDPSEAEEWRNTIAEALGLPVGDDTALPVIRLLRDEKALAAMAKTRA